ncbi:hypothetical protein COB21_01865 [Candidatus Aerophobetes bacterium]|uniref:Major facilitator superfamily (MFS) profile domain-containing protein n=1 Tax=Aerophobetes bacterium TaxID=2030807 RepID=A0A2A4X662_UNCAE|nr:MAG: hypothetical protein COB21_01865 [Candidatus Aerophobetes bacterium]
MSAISIKSQVKKMTSVIAIIGNILSHYNKHLYVFLIPFICPLFFPSESRINSLLLGWMTIPLGMLARPFGGYFFGKIGDGKGRETALSIALFGISFCTLAMIFLPTYNTIGILAPMFLILTRMGYNFFSAGSTSGSFVTVLGKASKSTLGLWSGIHTSSSVIGILVACFSVNLLALFGDVETSWRALYVLGLVAVVIGYYFKKVQSQDKPAKMAEQRLSFSELINSYKRPLIMVIAVYAYSRIMYEFSIGFLNGYIPIISNAPQKTVTSFDTAILLMDVFLLPVFGLLADKIGTKKIMQFAILGIMFLVPIALTLIPHVPFAAILGIKSTIALLAMLFTVPSIVWAFRSAPPSCRFSIIALGSALGTQIGGVSSALCLYLYKLTSWPLAPAFFTTVVSLCIFVLVKRYSSVNAPAAQVNVPAISNNNAN